MPRQLIGYTHGKDDIPQYGASRMKHSTESRMQREYKNSIVTKKAWARKLPTIRRIAPTRKQQKDFLLKSSVKKHFSELYKLGLALSRVPHATVSLENSNLHTVKWPIQKLGCDYALSIPPPYYTPTGADGAIDLSDFLCKLPDSMRIIYEKADPKKLINLMLPKSVIHNEARKVAAAFWLWLCITDDILEDMEDEEFVKGIREMHASLDGSTECDSKSQISFVTNLFREMVYNTDLSDKDSTDNQWKENLITCVQEIAHAFEIERPLLRAGKKIRLEDWMKIRVVTISARPFMILAKASLGIQGGMSRLGNPLLPDYQKYTGKPTEGETDVVRLETTLQCILGLQNDILGWEKDNHEGNFLNCIQILAAQEKARTTSAYEEHAINTAIKTHDQLVISAVSRASELFGAYRYDNSNNSSRRESCVPSLCTSGPTSTEPTPGTSTVDLCSPTGQKHVPKETEVDIHDVDTDSDSESPSRELSIYLFGRVAKISWSILRLQTSRESPGRVSRANPDEEQEKICQYVNVLLNMANGMANWMINCKRYAVKHKN